MEGGVEEGAVSYWWAENGGVGYPLLVVHNTCCHRTHTQNNTHGYKFVTYTRCITVLYL